MDFLVVYYSNTGKTKKAGLEIASRLKCDSEEIRSKKSVKGLFGSFAAGISASQKKPFPIYNVEKDPANYNTIIIGTPVWAGHLSGPVREYLLQNSGAYNKIAFFCVSGKGTSQNAFFEMEALCERKPVATLELSAAEVSSNDYVLKLERFIGVLKKRPVHFTPIKTENNNFTRENLRKPDSVKGKDDVQMKEITKKYNKNRLLLKPVKKGLAEKLKGQEPEKPETKKTVVDVEKARLEYEKKLLKFEELMKENSAIAEKKPEKKNDS